MNNLREQPWKYLYEVHHPNLGTNWDPVELNFVYSSPYNKDIYSVSLNPFVPFWFLSKKRFFAAAELEDHTVLLSLGSVLPK